MVKFKSLAQFPVDDLTQEVLTSLMLLLHCFVHFSYFAINYFVFVITYFRLAIMLIIIGFRFTIIDRYGALLSCY